MILLLFELMVVHTAMMTLLFSDLFGVDAFLWFRLSMLCWPFRQH